MCAFFSLALWESRKPISKKNKWKQNGKIYKEEKKDAYTLDIKIRKQMANKWKDEMTRGIENKGVYNRAKRPQSNLERFEQDSERTKKRYAYTHPALIIRDSKQ